MQKCLSMEKARARIKRNRNDERNAQEGRKKDKEQQTMNKRIPVLAFSCWTTTITRFYTLLNHRKITVHRFRSVFACVRTWVCVSIWSREDRTARFGRWYNFFLARKMKRIVLWKQHLQWILYKSRCAMRIAWAHYAETCYMLSNSNWNFILIFSDGWSNGFALSYGFVQ